MRWWNIRTDINDMELIIPTHRIIPRVWGFLVLVLVSLLLLFGSFWVFFFWQVRRTACKLTYRKRNRSKLIESKIEERNLKSIQIKIRRSLGSALKSYTQKKKIQDVDMCLDPYDRATLSQKDISNFKRTIASYFLVNKMKC